MLDNRVYVGDSAVVAASIYDSNESLVTVSSVTWEFLRPDGTPLIVDSLPVNPAAGSVYVLSSAEETFSAWTTVKWDGQQWNVVNGTVSGLNSLDNEGTLTIPGDAINQVGVYRGRAKFTLPDQTVKSALVSFEAYDPFESSMPVIVPVSQYFTNSFVTNVLTVTDTQANISGIDVGASITIQGPGFSNIIVPDPASTESISTAVQSGASSFATNSYEYVVAYRKTVGTDGNYVEGYGGLPQTLALDATHKAALTFTTALDPTLSRAIYRHVVGSTNWNLVVVLDNTAQTYVDTGASIGSYPPSGWYGSTELAVTFYAEQAGSYLTTANVSFTVKGPNGRSFTATRSLTATTPVWDPSILNAPANTIPTRIVDHAWMKLEDLFDSDLGGPWLSDQTLKSFNKDKLALLLPDALYLVNNEFQPITNFTESDWPEDHIPLAAQALMIEGIYHLIRSYVEQPLPSGGTLNWYDRRDYLTRWQSVLQKEEDKLMHLADKFKLAYTGFGSTSMIVGGYATPITRMSRFWRTRYPRYIGPWGF